MTSDNTNQDAAYDRYANIFENPMSAESIEVGNRALHWLFMENFQSSTAYEVVTGHAVRALRNSRDHRVTVIAGQYRGNAGTIIGGTARTADVRLDSGCMVSVRTSSIQRRSMSGQRGERIKELGNKIFDAQEFTMDEMREYVRLTNDSVLGRQS